MKSKDKIIDQKNSKQKSKIKVKIEKYIKQMAIPLTKNEKKTVPTVCRHFYENVRFNHVF